MYPMTSASYNVIYNSVPLQRGMQVDVWCSVSWFQVARCAQKNTCMHLGEIMLGALTGFFKPLYSSVFIYYLIVIYYQ